MQEQMMIELVEGILKIMSNRLASIVLYGSVARGNASHDSDIDIALFINGSLDAGIEDKLSDFIVDMNLKYDKVFSVIDIDLANYKKWEKVAPFYKNVEQDGIVLWKAA